ncbi:hypothetical protein N7501_001565 [Penicillium viridicatum]|nr:hypothetical protein N7501_001565 [Penicillium viridicatum]
MCDLLLFVPEGVRLARKIVIVGGGNKAPGHETGRLIITTGDEAMGAFEPTLKSTRTTDEIRANPEWA